MTAEQEGAIRRLNWGCGEHIEPGWINSDIKSGPRVHIACDIRDGLPIESDTIDYAVSVHALPELSYPDLVPALEELRRVLKPGGPLRLCLPDLDKGIRAYLDDDRDYFFVPDEEMGSTAGKFIVQMVWYGYTRTLFTYDFAAELATKAGFQNVTRCDYRQTASPFPGILELDVRERESFFLEATK